MCIRQNAEPISTYRKTRNESSLWLLFGTSRCSSPYVEPTPLMHYLTPKASLSAAAGNIVESVSYVGTVVGLQQNHMLLTIAFHHLASHPNMWLTESYERRRITP